MAVFKCKMCGGNLDDANGSSIATCEYCGTKQTVPTAKDENLQGLYNRANTLRIKSEFDKAEELYEKILHVDGTQAEAYWGIILCKYGIEYVEDPATFRRMPTCHRASYDSIIADEDYKSALEYADGSQKIIYEQEAKEIDRIQKDIIELSSKEEPYDVFICYKETNETGSRTQDSVIANDIYYQLTNEGFKVFYAAITLEDKLGSAYEPCIFAALNSAKVMLAIGTKPDYFNAVWVKNEWSRYLKIMKEDRTRILIPCYKDMDAYDLPEEFAHLQAQDMGKIGFINDVVRGIKKVVSRENSKSTPVVNVVNNTTTEPLLKRAFIFLEDGDWNSANEYCEKVLDVDPECSQAYLGKLMAELHINKQEHLQNLNETFESNSNYSKVIRYADDTLKNELIEYINNIKAKAEATQLEKQRQKEIAEKEKALIARRNKKIALIVTPIIAIIIACVILLTTVIIPTSKYNNAIDLMKNSELDDAYAIFSELGNYKDSISKLDEIKLLYLKNYGFEITKDGFVTYGSYEQDNNKENGKEKIEWIVLKAQNNRALLLSKHCLESKAIVGSYRNDVTWENSDLYEWLNTEFVEVAFSNEEKNNISKEITLLTSSELYEFSETHDIKTATFTRYGQAFSMTAGKNGETGWWLKGAGNYVDSEGLEGYTGPNKPCGVRPVIWIDLSKHS